MVLLCGCGSSEPEHSISAPSAPADYKIPVTKEEKIAAIEKAPISKQQKEAAIARVNATP